MKAKTILILAALLTAVPAMAGTTVTGKGPVASTLTTTTDSGWRVSASLYGWLPRLDGDITVHGVTTPVDVPFEDIFDSLDFTIMGLVEVGKGKWSFLADLFYVRLDISSSTRAADFNTEIEQFIGNFAVFYNLVETSSTRFDAYAGARVNWMETDLTVRGKGPFGRTLEATGDKTWVDPIVGFRLHQDLSEKFFVRALADIGGFGAASDLTWQAMASLGYRVTDNASLSLGYRGLGTDYSNDDKTYDVITHGLLLGFQYNF